MATFTNFATLSYRGGTTESNTVVGELLEPLTMTKTAVMDDYTAKDDVTYVISLVNSGTTALTGLTVTDENGNEVRVLNKKDTILAQQKQQAIKDAFRDWIWKDPDRRDRLTTLYNTKFNSIRSREYDGSHICFTGMNPEITLRPHQVNAIARILYGGNTLLAHVVGAGKSATRS